MIDALQAFSPWDGLIAVACVADAILVLFIEQRLK
jgi:hypothetical protein